MGGLEGAEEMPIGIRAECPEAQQARLPPVVGRYLRVIGEAGDLACGIDRELAIDTNAVARTVSDAAAHHEIERGCAPHAVGHPYPWQARKIEGRMMEAGRALLPL